MDWPYEIAERDHDIQNPTSAEKVRLLGAYLRLGPTSRVLDIACGKAGPAVVLASSYGCKITGVELRAGFADEARARVAANGLESLVEIHTADAREYPLEPKAWDAALCLGAAFVWGHIGDAAAALLPAVKPGGFVAIGEPFWRQWPLPEGIDEEGFVELASTTARFAEPASRSPESSPPTRTTGTGTRVCTGARSKSGSQPIRKQPRSPRDTLATETITSASSARSSAGRSSSDANPKLPACRRNAGPARTTQRRSEPARRRSE